MKRKTMFKHPTFKKGDFVRISEGTHDRRMPASRMGHLIERIKEETSVWKIYLTNGVESNFHEMYFEKVIA